MKTCFSASLMCADWLNMGRDLRILNQSCQMLHVDIMDGHFCKSLYLSPAFIASIRNATDLPIEAHLMVEHPEDFIEETARAGADYISVHAETIERQAFRLIDTIHALGCMAGVVLSPATPFSAVEPYLNRLDLVTVMTVDAGFAGQAFLPEMLPKIRQVSQWKRRSGQNYLVQADGAVNKNTYRALFQSGVDSYVLGSSGLFGLSGDLPAACEQMKAEFAAATREEG